MVFEGNIKESIFEQTTFYYQKDIPRNINKILTPKTNLISLCKQRYKIRLIFYCILNVNYHQMYWCVNKDILFVAKNSRRCLLSSLWAIVFSG